LCYHVYGELKIITAAVTFDNDRSYTEIGDLHCVSKKTSPTFLAITRQIIDGFL